MNNNIAKDVIAYFNKKSGKAFRYNNAWNVDLVNNAIDGAEISDVYRHIDDYVDSHEIYSLADCMNTYTYKAVSYDTNTREQTETSNSAASLFDSFMKASASVFSNTMANDIADSIMNDCLVKFDQFIKEEYGAIPKKIELTINDKIQTIEGVVHAAFDDIMDFVYANEPVFLVGPSGSGKSFIVQQVAKALNLPYYFSNAITQEYYLTGYSDANGNYVPTSFYKAWTEGGVFLLDEMDASIPDVLVKLNEALANKRFDFPAPIGNVEAHPNFRVVAAGNTYGLGADFEYVGRNQLDAASLDRFGIIKVDYDRNIELAMANGDENMVTFFHEVRKACERNGIQLIASYRGINRVAKMKELRKNRTNYDLSEILISCLFKGLGKDDLRHIYENLDSNNEYKEAMEKIAF